MTSEFDVLERFVNYHDHIAVPAVPVVEDVRRGRRRVRRNRGLAAGGAALAVAAVVVTAALFAGNDSASQQPIGPPPTKTTAPEPTTAATGWTGPLRENGSGDLVFGHRDPATDIGRIAADARDAGVGEGDIRGLRITGYADDLRWVLDLRAAHPKEASALEPEDRVIEYGVVIDGNGDHVADCEVGINNDAPRPGDYRVWVKNLRTGVRAQQLGGPYGYPIDFGFYDRQVVLVFLTDTPDPCDPFTQSARVYAWSSVSDSGRLTGWDYAPNTAWLSMRAP